MSKKKNQTAQERSIIFNGTVGEEIEEETKEAKDGNKKKGRRHKVPD